MLSFLEIDSSRVLLCFKNNRPHVSLSLLLLICPECVVRKERIRRSSHLVFLTHSHSNLHLKSCSHVLMLSVDWVQRNRQVLFFLLFSSSGLVLCSQVGSKRQMWSQIRFNNFYFSSTFDRVLRWSRGIFFHLSFDVSSTRSTLLSSIIQLEFNRLKVVSKMHFSFRQFFLDFNLYFFFFFALTCYCPTPVKDRFKHLSV